MRKFSNVIVEANYSNSTSMLQSEITSYINKVKRSLPADVVKAIYITDKYNIGSQSVLDKIKSAARNELAGLAIELKIDKGDLDFLWKELGVLVSKNKLKLLPQYQSQAEREMIEAGKLASDDLTLDLESQPGRNAVAKMYMPVVLKIVNSYLGKSRLDKSSLISVALEGLTDAMNEWKPESETAVPFKTYVAYRVKQAITNEMSANGHALSGSNNYSVKKYGTSLLDAVSIDALDSTDDSDKLAALGELDSPETKEEESKWSELYKILDKTFSQRDMDIFYRYFGLNGRKREKSKDIASSLNMHPSGIKNNVINKIIKWLKGNRKAFDVLADLRDIYTEALMYELRNQEREQVIENLMMDDTYILLEELNKWKNKSVFIQALNKALMLSGDQPGLTTMLRGDFNDIDNNYKKMKDEILSFLSNMYPTMSFKNKTDVDILDAMVEIQNAYKQHNLYK